MLSYYLGGLSKYLLSIDTQHHNTVEYLSVPAVKSQLAHAAAGNQTKDIITLPNASTIQGGLKNVNTKLADMSYSQTAIFGVEVV